RSYLGSSGLILARSFSFSAKIAAEFNTVLSARSLKIEFIFSSESRLSLLLACLTFLKVCCNAIIFCNLIDETNISNHNVLRVFGWKPQSFRWLFLPHTLLFPAPIFLLAHPLFSLFLLG